MSGLATARLSESGFIGLADFQDSPSTRLGGISRRGEKRGLGRNEILKIL